MSGQPSPTLFVQNLDEKLKKQDLKRILYYAFSAYGKVLDVVVVKGEKMRGTAHVVYRDLQGATQAMRYLDGSGLLGRSMKIAYAKTRSHATIKHEAGVEALYLVKLGKKDPNTLQDIGTDGQLKGKGRMIVSGAQAAEIERRKAEAEAAKKMNGGDDEDQESDEDAGEGEGKKVNGGGSDDDAMEEDSDDDDTRKKSLKTAAAAAVAAAGKVPIAPGEEPNPILFLEGLPAEVTEDMMAVLFQQYPGFQSVKLVPGRAGIAFVQFDTTMQSEVAKTALDGFQLAPGVEMKVGFARPG